MATNYPSLSELKQAVKVAEKIENLKSQLHSITGGVSVEQFKSSALGSNGSTKTAATTLGKGLSRPSGAKSPAKKRGMSAEGRARIAEAQKRRWAAARKAKKK